MGGMSTEPEVARAISNIEDGDDLAAKYEALEKQLGHAIVGQQEVIRAVVLTIFSGSHALVVGVPGLAKTRLVRSLGRALDLSFKRIQFTPDLMPTDITGTDIIEEDPNTGKRRVEFLQGPVFANLVLADEINRTPPKTQAAMLQTMEEHEVSVGTKTHSLPSPFHVFATQNPLEMEGTYSLPEAQADRFMLSIHCDYPSRAEEETIVSNTTGGKEAEISPVFDAAEVLAIQQYVRSIPVSAEVVRYAVDLVSRTRPADPHSPKLVQEYVRWGASPRASQALILGAKAMAAISGAVCADYEGVRSVALEVLRHRIILNFHARAQKISERDIVTALLSDD